MSVWDDDMYKFHQRKSAAEQLKYVLFFLAFMK